MTAARASVIVVSRHRPQALHRCIIALFQQDHPNFELIIIADPEGVAVAQATVAQAGQVAQVVCFDEANISAARNQGLLRAAGDVVAFIDDDAVAEPSWLTRLSAPFANPAVVAATGFVRGRNGISYQWQASEVDALAQDHPLAVTEPALFQGSAQRAVKTTGTNCAFRRTALLEIGGFDENLRFFLDEADVNLRLSARGPTAVVPGAEVHHGYEPSAHRRADRVPLSLFEIAASTAVFLRRHAPDCDLAHEWLRLQQNQAARLRSPQFSNRLNPQQTAALLTSLENGWQDGLARKTGAMVALPSPASPTFLPLLNTGPRMGIVLSGRVWQKARLLAKARQEVAAGRIATVICLAPTMRRHRVQFGADGVWLQSGGLFGQAARTGPRFRFIGFSVRVAEEIAQIATKRPTK